MRSYRLVSRGLATVLRQARYEVVPTPSIADEVVAHVPPDVPVAVTASPSKGLEPTLGLTERLVGHGYRVVPHVSARLVVDEVHLAEIVARLRALGVDDVFVPAGDADPPYGRYDAALPLLADLTALGRPFARVGITGYPQSHPAISDAETVRAMTAKSGHADYIVSNLCFDPKALRAWVEDVRRRGVTLPIRLGVAGPVERTRLLSTATKIGVEDAARFLGSHLSWFLRLTAPGGYSPDRLLGRLSSTLTSPTADVVGLHVFTFNQVAQTERWRRRLLARLSERPDAGSVA
ncbi:MAG: methylenetetrahydrofolate reductase [Actinomycetes bacterium]